MSDKTNEEKLRILQERLSSIQQKKEVPQEEKIQQDKPVTPEFEEDLVSETETDTDSTKKKGSAWKIIFFLILFAFLGGFGYYFYDNDFEMESTINSIKEDFNDMYVSLFDEEEDEEEEDEEDEEEEEEEDDIDDDIDDDNKRKKKKKVIYYESSFDEEGKFIIVLKTFDKEELANNEAQKLNDECKFKEGEEDFKVFSLSARSNSEEEVFQTYIGPFNTKGEANQYKNSDELISNGKVIELQ